MKWLSIDPSNNTGLAYWDDDKLLYTFTARKVGTKGKWGVEGTDGSKNVYESKWQLFNKAVESVSYVAMEEGFGHFMTAVKSQAHYRGYIQAVIDHKTDDLGNAITCNIVNNKEWKKVIKEEFGKTFPNNRKLAKELSKSLVEKAYGIRVSDDESDAVLLGRAVLRMGMVKYG